MKTIRLKYIFSFLLILLMGCTFQSCDQAESTEFDWPQFKKDNFRSGNAEIALDLTTLGSDWKYNASQIPVPAWYGPAKEDTYANSGPLPSMRDYDLAFYPIIVSDRLYFGSSADHAIHCLDANTSEELWTFTTAGPIRVAPTYHKGKLYFGSDDGYAYSIKANNGKLVWKYSPTEDAEKKVLNNNSFISFWPIRTGVLIEDDIAYFGASLLPWKESYFCAVNIKNGKVGKQGTYVHKFDDLTLEGSMASTGTKLVQPQGRISPMFFNRSTGETNGQLAGTGGCFVLITPEKNIVHPQSSREKGIMETSTDPEFKFVDNEEKKADFMSFKGGKEMVVKDNVSYILTDNSISAYDRLTKKVIWSKRNYFAHRIIISGDVLYVGGTDKIYAVSTKNGYPLWESDMEGTVYALAVANGALYASTGDGKIYRFLAGKGKNDMYIENIDKPADIDKEEENITLMEGGDLEFQVGPFINIKSPNEVEVHFETSDAVTSTITWNNKFQNYSFTEKIPVTEHRLLIPDVRKDFSYRYQIDIKGEKTKIYEFDNFFNYTSLKNQEENTSNDPLSNVVHQLNEKKSGLAVFIGMENLDKALEVSKNSDLKAILFEKSEAKVQKERERIQELGIYGGEIEIHQVDNYSKLPTTGDIANIVYVENVDDIEAEEVIRITRPKSHAIVASENSKVEEWLEKANNSYQTKINIGENYFELYKAPYESAGEWTHQYGKPNNSAFGGESLWGSTSTEDFEIQWMGRPGPRFQTDRSGRKPSPLSVNGKMFVQGRERIIAVDAYNGSVLWSKEIPDLSRMNILRDCSNWSADENYLYIAHKDHLLQISIENGEIKKTYPAFIENKSESTDWGYISLLNDIIVGSSVPKGSSYTNYYGGAGWYDKQSGPLSHQIVSYNLYGKRKGSDENLWVYKHPSRFIINSTITISDDQISFIESRNPRFRLSDENRADPEIFKKNYLVSLNPETGDVIWEEPISTKPGMAAFFMAASSGYTVIVSSLEGNYYIYAHDTKTGHEVWRSELAWSSDNHGAHLSKPAIVNNRLIVKPGIFELNTGVLLEMEVPKAGHGCASYALTEQSVFYRGGSLTQFNFDTNKFSKWERLRPDCWLSTIPAQGMVLSPEAGGGCSCGNWLETSMVFTPNSRAPLTFMYSDNNFVDSMSVTIKAKEKNNAEIYYTLDGTVPDKKAKRYSEPVLLDESCTFKAITYIVKEGKEAGFTRTKNFVRARPEPIIKELPELLDDNWQVTLEKSGNTGELYYTVDGSEPTPKSSKYSEPFTIKNKTLVKAKTFWKDGNLHLKSEEASFEILIPFLLDPVTEIVNQGIVRNFYEPKEGMKKEKVDLTKITPSQTTIVEDLKFSVPNRSQPYALRYEGYLEVKEDGMYTFSHSALEPYCQLTIHDQKIIESDKSSEEITSIIPLKAGLHPIAIDYFMLGDSEQAPFLISGPKLEKTELDASFFHHSQLIGQYEN